MNRELARKIADAVLYEGYMLYPYRRSALKNRQRWTFGILYPPAYDEVPAGTERSALHSECLLTGANATVEIELRFLHLAMHQVEGRDGDLLKQGVLESWDEGVERCVTFEFDVAKGPRQFAFTFPGSAEPEPLCDENGTVVGRSSCTQHDVSGTLSASTENVCDDVFKLSFEVANRSLFSADSRDRDAALLRSLLSAHLVMIAKGGEFVSLLDPPAALLETAGSCRNVGNFPVLVGEQNERDMLLCSPIVLYDYPQIAPESVGDFYDGTEMDEMLTLRVMTLTEQEKNEVRRAGGHARNLLQRTEASAREQLMRTHGTIRSLRPVSGER